MIIAVMLSVPMPSEAARFIGQILSIIISMILAIPNPVMTLFPFPPGEEVLVFPPFLEGEEILFLPEEVVVEDDLELLVGEMPPLAGMVAWRLVSLAFVSYTKSTACWLV